MICLLLSSLTVAVQLGPVERNAAFMASAKGLTVEFTAKEQSTSGVGQGRFVLRAPNNQSFSCQWGAESYRFTQSKNGTLAVRDDWKMYDEGQAYAVNLPPWVGMSGIADLAYPVFLLAPSLARFDSDSDTVIQGQETVRGLACDKVRIVSRSKATEGTHVFWVDQEGKVLRWTWRLQTQEGVSVSTVDFTKVTGSAPSDPSYYAIKLPIGYTPMRIPRNHTITRQVTDRAVFGNWLDVRKNKTVDVSKLVKGESVAIVFTDPDCAISRAAETFMAALRKELKSKGRGLIEVSLGKKSPPLANKDKNRQLYWDKDGTIEQAYGVPGTPYFLLADKKGILVSGWQGYSKSMEPEIRKTLLSAFSAEN